MRFVALCYSQGGGLVSSALSVFPSGAKHPKGCYYGSANCEHRQGWLRERFGCRSCSGCHRGQCDDADEAEEIQHRVHWMEHHRKYRHGHRRSTRQGSDFRQRNDLRDEVSRYYRPSLTSGDVV